MAKLICTVGPQGCGKSTWARQYMATHQNTFRVNGDDVRTMAYTGRWNSDKEQAVRVMQNALVRSLLSNGTSVVWDNMNLSPYAKMECKAAARDTNAELVWQNFTTSIDDCIVNDTKRGSTIGRAIIENTCLRYDLIPWNDYRKLVIVDLDGTLTDCEWRRKLYLDGPTKDWGNFLRRCGEDDANEGVLKWVWALEDSNEFDIVAVSGRNTAYWPQTQEALQRYDFNPKRIFMRGDGDRRPDWEVKLDILKHIPKEQILFAIDDRPTVIEKCWRASGIKAYPVGATDEVW